MQFDSLSAFFEMGGYGFFVWLSFFVTVFTMVALVVQSRIALWDLKQQAVKNQRQEQRIQLANHKNKQVKQ